MTRSDPWIWPRGGLDVKVDGLAATVEIQAGPNRVLAFITREAVEEMGLRPGMEAVATVKATSVMVNLPE